MYFFLSDMMNTGPKKNGTVWKPQKRQENIWLFSAEMSRIGKQDGRTALTVPIHQTARWFVIRKEVWLRLPKMAVVVNAILPLNGPVYGETDVVFLLVMH